MTIRDLVVNDDNRQPKAWGDGRYTYCLKHKRSQVSLAEDLFADDPILYEGRKCDWCGDDLA
jgi:hypothetical protein